MPTHWLRIESWAYWVVFVSAFLVIGAWESARPRRKLALPLQRRWTCHGIVLLISSLIATVAFRITPVAVALAVSNSRLGLLNRSGLPFAARWVVAVLLLDLTRYAVHRGLHATGLWHVHQVHHSDPDFDLTTGARVHPIELLLLQGGTLAAILLFAPPVTAVLFAEFAHTAQSFFSHANISLPPWIERSLRLVVVTPDMHRIHHSTEVPEQSTNFGFLFTFWDRLFGTFLAEPAAGQDELRVGCAEYRDERTLNIEWMLLQPFRDLRLLLRGRST